MKKTLSTIGIVGPLITFSTTPAVAMDLYVQPQNGDAYSINLGASETVNNARALVSAHTASATETICLVFDNQLLVDGSNLSDYGVLSEDVLYQYRIPSMARWSITPDDPIEGSLVHNYVDTTPLPSTNFEITQGALPQGVTLDFSTGIVD